MATIACLDQRCYGHWRRGVSQPRHCRHHGPRSAPAARLQASGETFERTHVPREVTDAHPHQRPPQAERRVHRETTARHLGRVCALRCWADHARAPRPRDPRHVPRPGRARHRRARGPTEPSNALAAAPRTPLAVSGQPAPRASVSHGRPPRGSPAALAVAALLDGHRYIGISLLFGGAGALALLVPATQRLIDHPRPSTPGEPTTADANHSPTAPET